MELICNELSLYPLVNSGQEAELFFRNALKTFEKSKEDFGFTHIRFPIDFQNQLVTTTQKYMEWVTTISNRTLRDTVIKLFRPPFTDDLKEEEIDVFFNSDYTIADEDAPIRENPVGLPVAHILSFPTLSFNTNQYWQKRKINILKTNTSETENLKFHTYNICLETDLASNEFKEWTDSSMSTLITNSDVLKKYLGFTKYQVEFTDDFMKELLEWKKEDIKNFKYTLLLMKDVQIHPFTGGMGKTENLKKRGKEASKRISNSYPDGHRLSYFLENSVVKFVACKGHYKFH
jgi:Txe/YoeB family toxin of Txe-Axe toxin-antitoxin module